MSINTSAYRVYVGAPVPTRTRADRAQAKAFRVRETLIASVQLLNRSSQDLMFSFADDAAAQRRFDFRVFNSEGTEVWASNNVESDAVAKAANAALRKRSKWSASVQIPLKIDDVWLAPGVYTVEASLAGELKIGATTLFEVARTPEPAPQPENTGIKGQVFALNSANEIVVAPGMMVSIRELRQEPSNPFSSPFPFLGSVVTDNDGRFQVNTPPGHFEVVAQVPRPPVKVPMTASIVDNQVVIRPPPPLPEHPRDSKVVQVTAGQFSEVRLNMQLDPVENDLRKIASVSSVEIRVLPTLAPPSMIEVSSKGMVSAGGWSNGQLRQRGITPDGIIEFDFVAKPPPGIVTQVLTPIPVVTIVSHVLTPISAVTTVPQPPNFRGVRVFAQSNSKEPLFE